MLRGENFVPSPENRRRTREPERGRRRARANAKSNVKLHNKFRCDFFLFLPSLSLFAKFIAKACLPFLYFERESFIPFLPLHTYRCSAGRPTRSHCLCVIAFHFVFGPCGGGKRRKTRNMLSTEMRLSFLGPKLINTTPLLASPSAPT